MGDELGDAWGGDVGVEGSARVQDGGFALVPVVVELVLEGVDVVGKGGVGELGDGDFEGDRLGLLQ